MADGDFDGCARECRKAGAHTLRWGRCEHAPEPEPHLSVLRHVVGGDGNPSIATESISLRGLADQIEKALRTININLGPNALRSLERGERVGLSGGEYGAMALAAAKALIDGTPEDARTGVSAEGDGS